MDIIHQPDKKRNHLKCLNNFEEKVRRNSESIVKRGFKFYLQNKLLDGKRIAEKEDIQMYTGISELWTKVIYCSASIVNMKTFNVNNDNICRL